MRDNKFKILLFALLLGIYLGSCKKDDVVTDDTDDTQEDPEAVERARVLSEYNTYYVASEASNSGWTGNTSTCTPGTISADAMNKALIRINYFRRCVGLNSDITFDATKNGKCQEAALMLNANGTLSHTPPNTWSCWTQNGSDACGSSNIAMGYSITGSISAYMNDFGSSNKPVGHRRWVLYSKAKVMGIGHTSTYNALWVMGNSSNPVPSNMPAFIPWPPKGYVPAPLVYARWSFSKRLADFTNTTVSMTDGSGNAVPCTIVSNTDDGYGDNTIVWEPTGINTTSASDVPYNVTVSHVNINGNDSTYTYKVTIIKP